jgi:hypothetical protein
MESGYLGLAREVLMVEV